jgi:hypothetical protein
MAEPSRGRFALRLPLDASGIKERKAERALRVVVHDRGGTSFDEVVRFDARGHATATFSFAERPRALQVVVGPENATAADLLHMQTLVVDLPPHDWEKLPEFQPVPIPIPPYWWWQWWDWCRTFTIRGRVVCPDGSPVPGATVCASDVRLWWWWLGTSQVGCATTDATGSFEIDFTWCCGWWPWWWWQLREWQLEPILAEVIAPHLPPRPGPPPPLTPKPDFAALAAIGGTQPVAAKSARFEPDVAARVRSGLVAQLPRVPGLEPLRVWPWWPIWPWLDCDPDIIFKVTQDCLGQERLIVNETIWDTRWDIPTTLNVTLVANDEACCIQVCADPNDCPTGNCAVVTDVCSTQTDSIGGNPGAPADPAGFAYPAVAATWGDRPFAGTLPIYGAFGALANVDFYEFEWSDDGKVTWQSMPVAGAAGFSRSYWGPPVGGVAPIKFWDVPFPMTTIGTHRVIETRSHFEASNDPGTWGASRFWAANTNLLIQWLTEGVFADGLYHLRIKGWNLVAGNLTNPRILLLCDLQQDNDLVLSIDNRVVGLAAHPSVPGHVCGGGTVHTCTREPDSDFLDIRVNGQSVMACDIVDAKQGGPLVIDFVAHDPDGHLGYYSLQATYGENLVVDLLSAPGATLAPGPASPPFPAAAQVGPDYGAALGQGALSPNWKGGSLRLTIPDLRQAFPVNCAYQLELRAYKRTIAGCDYSYPYRNLSEFSFTVLVV